MIYNDVIGHLKAWCAEKAGKYHGQYDSYGGMTYVAYLTVEEMQFKLSSLMDRAFDSPEAFEAAVLDLADVHYDRSLLQPKNQSAVMLMEKVKREFCGCLQEVLYVADGVSSSDLPYYRVFLGDDATELIERFQTVWGYRNTDYWFPLANAEPETAQEKFFVMFEHLEPHLEALCRMIGLPEKHIYEYGESVFLPKHCAETAEIAACGGHETFYTDKDFSWGIYFSHENTVSFAGEIVPAAKALLAMEKEHWNQWEWN